MLACCLRPAATGLGQMEARQAGKARQACHSLGQEVYIKCSIEA